MQDLWNWVLSKNIQVKVELVKSEDSLADKHTRGEWTQGTTLSTPKCSKKAFGSLEVTYFQPGICLPPQETQSVSTSSQDTSIGRLKEWMHCHAHSGASLNYYANPPWKLVGAWLNRLGTHPELECLLVAPMSVSAWWWPLLIKMKKKTKRAGLVVQQTRSLFLDYREEEVPPQDGP